MSAKALKLALARVAVTRFEGLLCRAVHSGTLYCFSPGKLYTPRPLYNLGPAKNGARFTPKGGGPALYLAEDFETSLREYLQLGKTARLKPRSAKEGAIVCFTSEVRLEAVLDLTNSVVQKALGTDDHELKSPWRYRKKRGVPPTHRLGRAIAAAQRFDAVRFKSSKGDGDCFMILTEALVAPSFVEVKDPISLLTQRIP
ncbi:MAG: RES family NAD+ phosphorylase [Acidobacteriota bacterium]|nr:RES family NAD+ phosphorylase [Acidobacteriota bacterium]